MINEFGNVLVPSDDGSRVLLVGNWRGPIWIEDAREPERPPLELYSDDGLSPGDAWIRPYVGTSYFIEELSAGTFLSSRNEREVLGVDGYLRQTLLPLLRAVRWESKMHFIITLGGLLLTRVTVASKRGPEFPVFAGRLNLNEWKLAIGAL